MGAAGEDAAVLDLVREIEATYPGFRPIPAGAGRRGCAGRGPLLRRSFGSATIDQCLLLQGWESLVGPLRLPPDPPLAPEVPLRGSVLDRGDVPDDDDPTRSR